MHTRRPLVAALAGIALVTAACGSDDPAPSSPSVVTEDSMVDDMTEDSMVDDMTEDSMVDDMTEEGAGAEASGWQAMTITDVDGVEFTLADLQGRPVLVETFATWCSNCRAQLRDTQDAAAELGDEAVVLALSVETDLDAEAVADYAADNGFGDIRFAVMTPELLAAMADAVGTTVANPPATPKLVVDAMGQAGELSTGPQSAADLVELLRGAA